MGNSEDARPSGSEKSSSPATQQDQNNVPVYPDWAAMQAFYGARLAMPPYMNTSVASPHTPLSYMWGAPQSMMLPYGGPYAAFYAHGGVYAHPGIPLAGTPLSVETQAKSSGNTDKGNMDEGFVKKLKEVDGLAISIGNGNLDRAKRENQHKQSDSEETEGSSDGSNRVATTNGKKRSRQGSPNRGGDCKGLKEANLVPVIGGNHASGKVIDAIPLKTKENPNTALELKDPPLRLKSGLANDPQPQSPNESWMPDERELKRERRKQSNRESARRSRLRKLAETEELAAKVQALTAENMTLSAEINKLMQRSEKLKLENVALTKELRAPHVGQIDDTDQHKTNDPSLKPVKTANLLARVNNSSNNDPSDRTNDDGVGYGIKRPGAKLHQLLDANPRAADSVAAS